MIRAALITKKTRIELTDAHISADKSHYHHEAVTSLSPVRASACFTRHWMSLLVERYTAAAEGKSAFPQDGRDRRLLATLLRFLFIVVV